MTGFHQIPTGVFGSSNQPDVTEVMTMSSSTSSFLKQAGWWIFFLVCAFYASYALYLGIVEILVQQGLVADAKPRAVPLIFIIHALAGGIVLISGPLQFNRCLFSKKQKLHRVLGRAHVAAIWLASIGGLWSAIFFEVDIAAKIIFGMLSILWFGTTTIAFLRILKRDFAAHREWMIRSFSLSLFFVSFSFWAPGLASTDLPKIVSYPLAVFLSWSLNLLVAELWIRHTRPQSRQLSTHMKRNYPLQKVH
jgi:Predicted membrane protein (DUF2306)